MNYKHRVLLFILLTLAPFASHAQGPSVSASGVWIREAPPGVEVLAGYLVLTNHTDTALTLTGVISSDFGSVAVHQSVRRDGQDGMQPVPHFVIPAHQSVTLAPGGYHLMLMKPAKRLFDGDLVTLTLDFSDGSSLAIMAPVRREPPAH